MIASSLSGTGAVLDGARTLSPALRAAGRLAGVRGAAHGQQGNAGYQVAITVAAANPTAILLL
ncbi:hypothetical protein MMRN_p0430 (plasmid) [Mycobacterium marinum]|nr:hypothetical protein MMRN_p0430 [Mycobacterium marinum]